MRNASFANKASQFDLKIRDVAGGADAGVLNGMPRFRNMRGKRCEHFRLIQQ
jgi:hypothetical protein